MTTARNDKMTRRGGRGVNEKRGRERKQKEVKANERWRIGSGSRFCGVGQEEISVDVHELAKV